MEIALRNEDVRLLVVGWWRKHMRLNSWPERVASRTCKHLPVVWHSGEEIDERWFDEWQLLPDETDIFRLDLLESLAHLDTETLLLRWLPYKAMNKYSIFSKEGLQPYLSSSIRIVRCCIRPREMRYTSSMTQ